MESSAFRESAIREERSPEREKEHKPRVLPGPPSYMPGLAERNQNVWATPLLKGASQAYPQPRSLWSFLEAEAEAGWAVVLWAESPGMATLL